MDKFSYVKNDELELAALFNFLEEISYDLKLESFKYREEFINKWNKFLLRGRSTNHTFYDMLANKNDQIFFYTVMNSNTNAALIFNASYIKKMYDSLPRNIKIQDFKEGSLKIKHDKIFYDSKPCKYTLYSIDEFDDYHDYDDEYKITIVPLYNDTDSYDYLVIDGNHRINAAIAAKVKWVKIIYADFGAAARALYTTYELYLYCMMQDYSYIVNNIQFKNHWAIFQKLNINDRSRALNLNRKRELNNKISKTSMY